MQLIVPVTVELVSMERQRIHFRIRRYHSGRVFSLVKFGLDPKPCIGSRIAYQIDNGFKCPQWLASPILRNVAEHNLPVA